MNINDWVNQGRDYIQEDTCPFCQEKTITDNFKEQLEGFFDETYLKDIGSIKKIKRKVLNLKCITGFLLMFLFGAGPKHLINSNLNNLLEDNNILVFADGNKLIIKGINEASYIKLYSLLGKQILAKKLL
mgnify:CR=1 FL=1